MSFALRSLTPILLASPDTLGTVVGVSSWSAGAHLIAPSASASPSGKQALLRIMKFVNIEYGEKRVLAYAVNPGCSMTTMTAALDEEYHHLLTDTPELAGDIIAWSTAEKRDGLAGSNISCFWDMSEFMKKRQQVIDRDLLKVRIAVE